MRRGYISSPIVVSLVTASARSHALHPAWLALTRSAPDALHHPRTAIAVATATSFVRGDRYGSGHFHPAGARQPLCESRASQSPAHRPLANVGHAAWGCLVTHRVLVGLGCARSLALHPALSSLLSLASAARWHQPRPLSCGRCHQAAPRTG